MKIPMTRIIKYTIYLAVLVGCLILLLLNINIIKNIRYFEDPVLIRDWIRGYGNLSSIAFIVLQMVQVIFFFIPGEFIQVAGGFIFGTFWGLILSVIGILLGSLLTFLAARAVGERILRKIIPAKQFEKLEVLINRPRNKLVIFILYLIPGIPKDILGYISGITPIKTKQFVIISNVARIPGIFASVYLGSNLYDKNYVVLAIVILAVIVLVLIIWFYKDKILDRFK